MAVFANILAVLLVGLATSSAYEQSLSESVKFGVEFYKHVREALPNENVIVSPLSVKTALGLLLMGAQGKTANELVRGMYLPTYERAEIASYFEELAGRYNEETLSIANKVFVRTGYSLNPTFNEVIKRSFKSEAQTINFADQVSAANIINSWVEEKTNGKIEKLFDPSSLSSGTRMVLANAVYFKGLWQNEFNKAHTRKDTFYLNDDETVQVDMMFQKMSARVADSAELDATVLLIPYNNSDLSLMIALPNSRNGLDQLEKKMETYDFSRVETQLYETDVELFLPKFEIESSLELAEILGKMGMGTMFSPAADFSKLLDANEPLSVDSGIHKAYIKVDEEGTEAAASTGFAVVMSMPLNPIVSRVKVDRPFFFAVVGPKDVPFVGSVKKF